MSRFNRSIRPLLDVIDNYGKYNLSFDGVDDYVQLGASDSFPLFQIDGTYTVEMRVNIRTLPSSGSAGIWNAGTDNTNRHGCVVTAAGYLVFGYYDGDYTRISIPVVPGEYHIACVNNEGSISLYVNGERKTGSGASSVIGAPSGAYFRVGRNGNTAIYLNGTVSDVRLWNVARSESEIQEAMNKVLIGNESGLVGLWILQEGAGRTVYDRSQYRRNGQIIGATWAVKS